ncbi:fimbria/pilus outer membrane usher protein [Enterobacter cloacae]|uniref:fimbria/pilus outer membrane usher protein n=1 Tax=Enterobacter cloacae TaxID=550 RepID=UPI002005FD6A|nr:fimbria/pilus outer membrane usher protein [Enterobacter cloacae]MCK7177121.1 fimbria/pilus outer membrane usher protein [Enterobacter cloacae]
MKDNISVCRMALTHVKQALLTALALILLPSVAAASDETLFDLQSLSSRNIDPSIASWFSQSARFLPGQHTIVLQVNGEERGRVKVRFDADGSLCADEQFFMTAGIITDDIKAKDNACNDLTAIWPQAVISADPGEGVLSVVLPQHALVRNNINDAQWSHGGTASMLNYDMRYIQSSAATSTVSFIQANTEAGFNAGDWIVRSRQNFSRFNGENAVQHQSVYAQRTFASLEKILQIGQIGLTGATQVRGFQLTPEDALKKNTGAGKVDGIADSQSIVEVRQSGILLYRTTVPAGPFSLDGFSLLNTHSDIEVTVIGTNQEKQQYRVTVASIMLRGNSVSPGLSFGAGIPEGQPGSSNPIIATVSGAHSIASSVNVSTSALGSSVYRSLMIGIDSQPFTDTLLSVQTTASDQAGGTKGITGAFSASYRLTEQLGLNATYSQQSSGYRDLSDSLYDSSSDISGRVRNTYGAGVGVTAGWAGSLSLSASRSHAFSGARTQYLQGSWSYNFGQVYLGASVDKSFSGSNQVEYRYYLNLGIELGKGRSLRSNYSSASGGRAGLRYSDRSSSDWGWGVSGDRDLRTGNTYHTAMVDSTTSLSQISGSVGSNSTGSKSWSASATGGMVLHDSLLSFSPYRIGDTFGVAHVPGEKGIRLDTPSGPVWTGRGGRAVIPSVNAYRRSSIQVDTRSLDKNVDITNAVQEVDAARGSFSHMHFDVVRTRRVLADVRDEHASHLPHGASIFSESGDFITVVGHNGAVFIPDAGDARMFEVQVSGKTVCSFILSLPENPDVTGLYETATAQCR